MAQTDILSSYETLLIYVEEVRSSMNLLYRWMNKDRKLQSERTKNASVYN